MASFSDIPRLNLSQLTDLIEVDQGRTELAREIWCICLEQVETRFAAMETALKNADFRAIEAHLHTFKTTCHSAGLQRAHVMSKETQKLVSGETIAPHDIRNALRQLRAEVSVGLTEVADYLNDREHQMRRAR